MFKKVCISIISIFLLSAVAYATDIQNLDTTCRDQRKKIAKIFKKRNKVSIDSTFFEYNKDELSYVKPIFKKFEDDFYEDILKGNYIFFSGFDSIINNTQKRLITANQFLNKDCSFYFSRDISLNAMSTLNNTFVVNLGTLYFNAK